ncbi:MAG: ribonuclease III [Pseudomonadota bacterium]
MKLSADLKAFASRLGHEFSAPELLIRALTHGSMSSENRPDNQRLEFLGDRVLGLVIAAAVMQRDPDATEGKLAPQLNALVRKETCADIAREIDLGAVLKLGKSEQMTGGRRKNALLGDAMEAVIAAVYLDAGFPVAQAVVLRLWARRLETVDADARDAKTALQEWAQARGQNPPQYREVSRIGPDHAPVFVVAVELETGEAAQGEARAKRAAEQRAAQVLLAQVST